MGLPSVLLIANRGEIVARIARTARSMGIRTVAVASAVDRDALHTRVCDEVAHLGGATPAESYLRIDKLLAAAERSGADAVHPGFGFLAEDATFARAVIDAGLTWVGPAPEVIAAMGDKLTAKRRMAAAGVPVIEGVELAGSAGDVGGGDSNGEAPGHHAQPLDDEALLVAAEQLGLPILVKATAGGGGKGMRAVHDLDAVVEEVAAARREAGAAFGDDRVFLERLLERPRHVEVQILGDTHGNLVHLFERECSIQRRHQKVLEESPSPGIDAELRAALTDAAVTAARAIDYSSAGTVEFIVDEALLTGRRAGEDIAVERTFAFLEVNTRLQVEHPVTEEIVRRRDPATGTLERLDLVREQLLVAAGLPLAFAQDELVTTGHAIEVRLYAEDPGADDLPGAGPLPVFEPAGGDGIRWELGITGGDRVPTQYDPMLAKAIAHGPTRAEAAARLAAALDATALLGVPTNRELLVQILRDERFLAGDASTAMLAERRTQWLAATVPSADEVLTAAILAAVHDLESSHRQHALVAGVPAGFTNAATFPMQQAYTTALPWPARGVGADPAGDPAVDGVVDGVGDAAVDGAVDGAGDAGVGGAAGSGAHDREEPGEDPLTVRMIPQRNGSYLAQIVAGVGPGHLDEDVEPRRSATVRVVDIEGATIEVDLDERRLRVAVHTDAAGRVQVAFGRRRVELHAVPRFPQAAAQEQHGASVAPMPGAVVSVVVAVGDRVEAGATLAIVEAMKTEHRVRAALAGTVGEIRVAAGDQVDADEVLVVVEPEPEGSG
jgi:acetyl/propionyl-CoA carboxylase alpha subunit